MRLRVICLLAVLCLTACKKEVPTPEHKPAPAPAPAPDGTLERPLLWSAKKDGNTTYILGTMHVGVEPKRLPDVVWKKLDEARSFAMESNPEDPALARMGERTAGGTLDADLGPAYFARLEKLIGADEAAAYNASLPMRVGLHLGMRGLPPTASMDHALWLRARRAKKRVTYLEEASHQVAMLTRLFDVRMLKYMIDDADNNLKGQRELLAAYIAGDAERLQAAGSSERAAALRHGFTDAEYDAMADELLYARNRAFVRGVEEIHADGVAFVAVGAMHLVGPNSLLDLLQKRGYEVARVVP